MNTDRVNFTGKVFMDSGLRRNDGGGAVCRFDHSAERHRKNYIRNEWYRRIGFTVSRQLSRTAFANSNKGLICGQE